LGFGLGFGGALGFGLGFGGALGFGLGFGGALGFGLGFGGALGFGLCFGGALGFGLGFGGALGFGLGFGGALGFGLGFGLALGFGLRAFRARISTRSSLLSSDAYRSSTSFSACRFVKPSRLSASLALRLRQPRRDASEVVFFIFSSTLRVFAKRPFESRILVAVFFRAATALDSLFVQFCD